MALTPEDVLKKSFGATQFRRGYDEREVDDFLDEVVNELRDLIAQRDDYKRKYEESVKRGGGAVVTKVDDERVAAQAKEIDDLRRRLQQAEAQAAQAAARPVADGKGRDDVARAELARVQSDAAKMRDQLDAVRSEMASKEAELARVREQLADARRAAEQAQQHVQPADDATRAAGVLAMAQQLHDQLVSTGESEKNRLVGEATLQSERLVAEAQSRHDALIAEAQERHKTLVHEATAQHDAMVGEASRKREEILRSLEEQRSGLERDIAALRAFESKYKQQLVGFLEGKLHEAKNTGQLEPKE